MALTIADRVRETTTTTGTGTITLGGAVGNFETFTANLSDGDTTYYAIVDANNSDFEVGLGTFTASGTTLARTTVIASSNSNSAVDLSSGSKDVFITLPARKMIFQDANGNVTIPGDLTVSGDVITMGTNSSGNLLIADGTNFNSIAGLKKITRSTIVSGLATSGAISNVVEDTTPQLGGNLDTNSHSILLDDAHFIGDENGNEQIIFQTTSSAVNQFDVTNAATGNAPELSATGDDTNISLKITPKGSGQVLLDGNVGIESGLIDLKNSGSRSQIKFYCESGNAHAQALQAAPHSESASNTLTLPSTGGDADLVSVSSTATLTNKTLSSPTINSPVITTIKNTSLVIGRDDDNLIKFSTDNQIIFEVDGGDNVIFKASGEIEATSLDISGDVDVDGTLEADAITVNGTALGTVIAGTTVTLASTVTVTDSTANTNFPVVFHDESNGLLDDTGALRYNPSTGTLLVPNLSVAGTTTTGDTVTMNAQNAIVFEGTLQPTEQ